MPYLNLNGRLLDLGRPTVMGIINLTPDSFYAASRYSDIASVLSQIEEMLTEGAGIIDIGAVSTRPHSNQVSVDTELERLMPVVESVLKNFPEIVLSIDSFQAKVVKEVAEMTSFIVNDISGFGMDSDILDVVALYKLPYILMHIKGSPQTMTDNTQYKDLIFDMLQYFGKKLSTLRERGIDQLILDPGIGFAKTVDQNFEIIQHLETFGIFEYPVMIGLSRKSFIYKTLKISADESLNGTTAMHMSALMKGAKILRAHDVKEAMQTIDLYQRLVSSVND